MNVQLARFKIKSQAAPAFEEALKRVFQAAERERLSGIRYSVYRLPGGDTYLGFLELENGVANPLPELPEGKNLLENLPRWTVEPPTRDPLAVVGSYRSF
jgi:hypothetical protein